MSKVIAIESFKKKAAQYAKKQKSMTKDLKRLFESLAKNPQQGKPLGAGLYKLRFAVESKGVGKSGGFRVITYFVDKRPNEDTLYLIAIYDKSETSTITKKELLKIVSSIMG